MQILTAFALLIPAFSLLYTPQPLALLFLRVYNAPLPNTLLYCLSFGVRFSPVKFSAQRRSTSELLRTLWMCGCFWANILVVFEIPHPFPLNTYFGTLAVGLGSFPFVHATYLTQTDSRGYLDGILSLIWVGNLFGPRVSSVLYLR